MVMKIKQKIYRVQNPKTYKEMTYKKISVE